MGWRGTLRSIQASSNRAARASAQRQRAQARFESQAERIKNAVDKEAAREIEKIRRIEEKAKASPVKTLKMAFDDVDRWTTAPIVDNTGRITYELKLTPPEATGIGFDPEVLILSNGITLRPKAISPGPYCTAIAFEAVAEVGRTLKLVTPTAPENSNIALVSQAGDAFYPLDSSLDGRLIGGAKKVGVVSFEPLPAAGVDELTLVIVDKEEERRIAILWPDLATDARTVVENAPRLLDSFVKQLEALQAGQRPRVDEVRAAPAPKKSSNAALGLVIAGVMGIGLVGLVGGGKSNPQGSVGTQPPVAAPVTTVAPAARPKPTPRPPARAKTAPRPAGTPKTTTATPQQTETATDPGQTQTATQPLVSTTTPPPTPRPTAQPTYVAPKASSSSVDQKCWVNGYTRKNGTRVGGYWRKC